MVVIAGPIEERKRKRADLLSRGFSTEMFDKWQPKLDYYRHSPRMTAGGRKGPKVVVGRDGKPDPQIGLLIPNQPGNEDTALRLSLRGLFPWAPSAQCECKWCRERNGTERTDKKFMSPKEAVGLADTKFYPDAVPEAVVVAPEPPEPEVSEELKTRRFRLKCEQCKYRTRINSLRPNATLARHVRREHPKQK